MKNILLVILIVFCIDKADTHFYQFSLDTKEKVNTVVLKPIKVTVTCYYPTTAQCDSTPLITADGSKINPLYASEHKWVAVSRDLLKVFKYGDLVEISGAGKKDGTYRISDTMNKRIKNTVDILETSGTPIYKFKNITIRKISSC